MVVLLHTAEWLVLKTEETSALILKKCVISKATKLKMRKCCKLTDTTDTAGTADTTITAHSACNAGTTDTAHSADTADTTDNTDTTDTTELQLPCFQSLTNKKISRSYSHSIAVGPFL